MRLDLTPILQQHLLIQFSVETPLGPFSQKLIPAATTLLGRMAD